MCTYEPQKPALQANLNSPSSWQPTLVRLPIYTCSKGKRVSQTPQLTSTAKLRPGNTPTAESGPSSHSTWLTQTCHRTASPRHPPPKTLRFSLCILGSTAVTGNTKKKNKKARSCGGKDPQEAWWLLRLSAISICPSHLPPHFPTQLAFLLNQRSQQNELFLAFCSPSSWNPFFVSSHLCLQEAWRKLNPLPAQGASSAPNFNLPHEPADSYGNAATPLCCLTRCGPQSAALT